MRNDMTSPNFGERTRLDFSRWSGMDGIYYEKHPTNHGEMRTWRVSFNPIADRYQIHQPSNWVTAEPTPEMRPWHDRISRAITTMQPIQSRGFY